jgi:hypothetical protein
MSDATQVTFIDSVKTDDGKYDVWSETGDLDTDRLYVSQFAEDDVRPVDDPEVEDFIRNELS